MSARAGQTGSARSLRRCHIREREKRGLAVGPTRLAERGRKSSLSPLLNSLPLAVSVQTASPHESQLVEEVLAASFLDELPATLIGDRAYDSDRLDQKLKEDYDVELIAPHRGRRKAKTQDGRKLYFAMSSHRYIICDEERNGLSKHCEFNVQNKDCDIGVVRDTGACCLCQCAIAGRIALKGRDHC